MWNNWFEKRKNSEDLNASSSSEDFYVENGHRVFTEKYHLKRGYCCKSGCRHCPYGYDKNTDSFKKKK
ncbi:MAG: DUF5522 domain-containing protein [Weeksellaceae bacterium]|nr:DUF5522 domain-containing protein [Weeksellaceae bacterium]